MTFRRKTNRRNRNNNNNNNNRRLRRTQNPLPHKLRTETVDYADVSTFNRLDITDVTTGTSSFNRIGLTVHFRRLELRLWLQTNVTPAVTLVRFLVVVDHQPNLGDLVAADLYFDPVLPIVSSINPNASRRLTILRDWCTTLSQFKPVSCQTLKMNLNTTTLYNFDSDSDPMTNAIYLVWSSNHSIVGNQPHMTLQYTAWFDSK